MAPTPAMANPGLAGRIQGFGNVNPPPLEEDTPQTMAKRVVGNLGSMLGEEVLLTVDDFRQKGAVGAVKDAVADAGDLLIDGVAGVFGWLRGDQPPQEEDDSEKAQKAAAVLAQGPAGAAYGVSQASPSGGINAVWVMPEEADPSMLAELATQSRSQGGAHTLAPQAPMAVPGGPTIQPYVPRSMQMPGGPTIQPYAPQAPMALPGGANIQPYVPCAPGQRPAPFNPAAAPNFKRAPGVSLPASAVGTRGLVEQVAKGDALVGPQVVKRLLDQSASANLSGKQLAEVVCERARRLYLGLDSAQGDADAALFRLLSLVDVLAQQDSALAKETVKVIVADIKEELLSLQGSAAHRSTAAPMLQRLGLTKAAPEAVDLLGEGPAETPKAPAAAAPMADLLGGPSAKAQEVDLLGGLMDSPAPAQQPSLL